MTNWVSRAREGRALAALKFSSWGNWVNDDAICSPKRCTIEVVAEVELAIVGINEYFPDD